ncbi:hypothetical protein JYU34_010214 [Plutella xylostella]|uniref:Peptidase M14 domain-containing protein n=1 Tax=Plutella xylostella TaxID=51655 RepID=A0ABQ7QIG0_PLUXY|nr:hypothetical protein JYU34_010214 [Plutella xylostella]
MRATMHRALVFVLLLGVAYAKFENYEGTSVYEFSVKNGAEAKLMQQLEKELDLDIWAHPGPSRPGTVLVPKQLKGEFEYKLKFAGIQHKVQVDNIKEYMELEDKLLTSAKSQRANVTAAGLSFDRVYTWEDIDQYLEVLAEAYPDTVTVVNGGSSVERRPMKYLKISTTNFQDKSKPVIYMQSLLHAREWITQAASLYAIHRLVIDVTERDMRNDFDWIIVPVANPDGFVHTHGISGTFRYWRKNRSTDYGLLCMGVDLNRNFDVIFGTGSSDNVCSDTFHGAGPFSEPETQVIRDIIAEHKDRMELFLDIHSFGSWILYGYGNGTLPANALYTHLIGVQMAQAIDAVKKSYNPDYVVGNTALMLYEASGSAADYAISVGVPFSYTYELPGLRFDPGTLFGFLVDPAFIEQAGFETWEGIKVGARYARNSYRARKGLL